MITTKQNFFALLLALTFSLIGLTACGNNSNTTNTTSAEKNFTNNGFEVIEAVFTFPSSGLAQTPYNTDIVFAVNNVIDGSVQLQNASGKVGVFSLTFNLTAPYSGTVKFTITGEDNKEYTRTANADFAKTGENSFVALVNFDTAISGNYNINLYFDNKLAYSDELSAGE